MNINGATGTGGGNPDLVSGGAPTNGSQAKASGTTSSDAITFQAPTGGSGASTPSAALAHVVGSGASLSGSGLGPYTVNSLEDGDVVTVTCTHTDDGDGQVVKDVAVVDVAVAAVVEPFVSSTLAAVLSGADAYAFAPTLSISAGAAGGTWATTITRASDGAAVSVTGSTTTTPTATLNVAAAGDGDAFRCRSVYTDPSGYVGEFVTVYQVDGVSAGSWQTIHSYLFNTNVTDLTITKGAAAATLYESDGTTPIIDLRFLNRSNTPVSTAVCTAAAGKLLLTNESNGGTEASYVWGQITESTTGVDWDSGTTYAIDFVLTGLAWGADGDDCWIAFGTSASGISAGQNVGIRLRRTTSTDYNQNGRRYFGSASNGTKTNSETSAPTDVVVRIIVYYGALAVVYWQTGTTTPLTGIPTIGGSVYGSEMGLDGTSLGTAPQKFSATSYFFIDCQSTTGTAGTIGIEEIHVQKFA